MIEVVKDEFREKPRLDLTRGPPSKQYCFGRFWTERERPLIDSYKDVEIGVSRKISSADGIALYKVFFSKSRKKIGEVYMTMTELEEWAKDEMARDKERKKKIYGEKGYAEFWKPPVGTSHVEIVGVPRTSDAGQYGPSVVFPVKVGKGKRVKRCDWSVSSRSFSLLSSIKQHLAKGITELQVTRTGEGQSTRYTVVAA